MIVIGSTSSSLASLRAFRCAASLASFSVLAMRMTLFSMTLSRPLFFRIRSSAWSHGTLSTTMVTRPSTLGSSTKLIPEISWNSRNTSLMLASTRLSEIRLPVYTTSSVTIVRVWKEPV